MSLGRESIKNCWVRNGSDAGDKMKVLATWHDGVECDDEKEEEN